LLLLLRFTPTRAVGGGVMESTSAQKVCITLKSILMRHPNPPRERLAPAVAAATYVSFGSDRRGATLRPTIGENNGSTMLCRTKQI
jgi:hypothetical protein